jgi:hypothetical protein
MDDPRGDADEAARGYLVGRFPQANRQDTLQHVEHLVQALVRVRCRARDPPAIVVSDMKKDSPVVSPVALSTITEPSPASIRSPSPG